MKDLKPYIEITPAEDYGVLGFCFLEKDRRTFKKNWNSPEKMLSC